MDAWIISSSAIAYVLSQLFLAFASESLKKEIRKYCPENERFFFGIGYRRNFITWTRVRFTNLFSRSADELLTSATFKEYLRILRVCAVISLLSIALLIFAILRAASR